ncbi:MAG: ZIP family metal transporter [Isosphaeraceae bacterium]
MTFILSLDCALIVAVSLLGGILPLATVLTHTRLQAYLSFSAGSMLGAAFFHMLPEAIGMGSPGTVRWAAVGLLALFLLERFASFHQHEPQDLSSPSTPTPAFHGHGHGHSHGSHNEPHSCATLDRHEEQAKSPLSWGTAAFGLAVHSIVGGVALASAIAADFAGRGAVGATGWGVFLATVVHKPADALTIVSLMLRAGVTRRVAHAVNLAFALMIPVGVVAFTMQLGRLSPEAATTATAIALSFSAGTFLCIALSDLLPELQFHSHDRVPLTMALAAGFALTAGASLLEFA